MKKTKKTAAPQTYETRTIRCNAHADFGHTNLWGSPYLMFDVDCRLPGGHSGLHEAVCTVRLVPSHEPAGAAVKRKSVEVVGETLVRWALKPEAEEQACWKNFLAMWAEVGWKVKLASR